MQRQMKYYHYIFVIVLAFCSCSNNNRFVVSTNDATTIDIDNAEQHDSINMSCFLGKPKVIILETKPECPISRISSLEFFNNQIYVLDARAQSLYVFDINGNYLNKIGKRGKGKNEYIELSDFSIDRKDSILYLWDAVGKILKYCLKTNSFDKQLKVKREGYLSSNVQYSNGKIFLDRTSAKLDYKNYALREIDTLSGKQTASYLYVDEFNRGWNMPLWLGHSNFYSKNTEEPKFAEMFSDTIFSISQNGIVPAYIMKSKDFVTVSDVAGVMEKCKEDFAYDFNELERKNKVYQFSRLVEFGNMMSIQYLKGSDRLYLLYNKDTKKAIKTEMLINDYVCDGNPITMDFCYSDENGVVSLLRPEFISYFVDNVVAKGILKTDIDNYESLKNLSIDSNPVLFYHCLNIVE